MNKTAIILGATGLVGNLLLQRLLKDPHYSKIKVYGRSSCGIKHPKIEEHLGDLFHLEQFKSSFTGDVVFCCVGTTKAKTPDKETYKKIDYGIPLGAAQLAKHKNISHFLVISAMSANPNSSTFYNKVKGEMEQAIMNLNLPYAYIFKPSLIGGNREESRLGEKIAQIAFSIFDLFIPKKYKMIDPHTIAKAMLKVSNEGYTEVTIENHKIKIIAAND